MVPWAGSSILLSHPMIDSYDVIAVLGRGVNSEGDIPKSVMAAILKAIDLYREGAAKKIIFSGKWSRHFDFTPPITEAQAMLNFALSKGLPKGTGIIEEESLDTLSNCYYIKTKQLIPNGWKKILLLKMFKNDDRAEFLMKQILGPEYIVDTLSIDFEFPPEKIASLQLIEPQKLANLKEFLKDVTPGDHETIMKLHLNHLRVQR